MEEAYDMISEGSAYTSNP